MENFDFYNPTHIVFGKDRLKELNKLVPKDAKVLILYGGGSVKKFGTLEKVKEHLKNRSITEFGGIEPNPSYETLMKAVEVVKKENINFLLAVGGGSVMDGTKFVSLAVNYKGDNPTKILSNVYVQSLISGCIPIGTVVTLPATGSEMNSGGVITYNHGKFVISNPLLFPKFSILDPTLTYTLPATQVANGIIDAFIHVIEQYVTYPVDARFQDRTAEGILQTLIEIGKQTIDNPEDYDARANLVWCATMALNGLIRVGIPQDWTTHMIGHELTALFGIDHAKTLAILQPSIWQIRKEQKREKLIQYAERVWNISETDEDKKIDLAINKTREFFEGLGVKTRLSDYGITADGIDDVVKALEKHGMTALSETKDLNLEISREILENAM
ncbi:MAG: NADH-dependent alcohol dehydrogenase [Bacteroidetes bacterium]|nr:MAG: NADH-dependent alcohol dehydrogenase [Bacteroidota bacterium]